MNDQSVLIPSNGKDVKIDPTPNKIQPLLEISPRLEQDRALDLKPLYISLGLEPSAISTKFGGFTDPAERRYGGQKAVFDSAIRGSGKYADRIWFFKGGSFVEYIEKPNGHDECSNFKPIKGNWPDPKAFASDWPTAFQNGIDAVLCGRGEFDGLVWFFAGSQYLRYNLTTNQLEGTASICNPQGWRTFPPSFCQGIDAVIHGIGDEEIHFWVFKGSQYIRVNIKTLAMDGPAPILGNWGGWPEAFGDGIDFAFFGTGPNDSDKIYFLRGDQYFVHNFRTNKVVQGPTPITDKWPMLERFMPQPQLFIVEQYELRNFHGRMGITQPPVGIQQIAANTLTEITIVTKTSQTISNSSSTNILESSSQQAVDAFSDALKTDDSQEGSQDKYGYSMDASFHGDAHTTLIGGEANADLHVKGESQDVRDSFAKAVGKQLEHKKSETEENHKQQVKSEASNYEVKTETETGYKQVVDNRGNPNALNFGISQLTQEYYVVLGLVDVQLAFHNGDPRQSKVVPIQEMASLLEQVVVEPKARAQIGATVVDTLQNIKDYTGQTHNFVVPSQNDPTRFQVDSHLTSACEVKDTDGKILRSIVVPGIIRRVDNPIVLTANTAIFPLTIAN